MLISKGLNGKILIYDFIFKSSEIGESYIFVSLAFFAFVIKSHEKSIVI